MKIIITGGAGYIGSHVALEALDHGHDVTVFDDFSNPINHILNPNIHVMEGSTKSVKDLTRLFDNNYFDAVIHLAANKASSESMNNPIKYSDNNIIGIESVIDSDGNIYNEVPYLAQETIYEEVENVEQNNPNLFSDRGNTPYLLRLKRVPKRFVTRFTSNNILQLQFGSGISSGIDEEIIIIIIS